MVENQLENQEAVVPAAGVVQIPRELPFIYRWVANDVLGTPSSLDQQYLDELKLTGVLFSGGIWNGVPGGSCPSWGAGMLHEPRSSDRPSLVVGERGNVHRVWGTDPFFGLPAVSSQPSLRGPVATSSKFMVVNSLFRVGDRVFGVASGSRDSFHDFKGRYFKIFPVGDHRPFWLSLEGDGRFPPYWSDQADFEIVPATYQRLNADQRDTADILVHLFAQNNLNPKFLMNNSDEARKASLPSPSTAVPLGGARSVPAESVGKTQADPEGGSSTNVGRENVGEQHVEISSPIEEEIPLQPPPSPKRRRSAVEDSSGPKRSRTLEGGSRDFCALDRSFDASGFVESHLLGPKAQEVLRDCDPLESVRWAEWEMIRAATIMKSVEPRLSIAEELERRNARLLADAKTLSLQKMVLEEKKVDAVQAKLKVEEDLKVVKVELEELEREKDAEADCFRRREEGLQAEVEKFRGQAAEEKVRADLAEASAPDLQKRCEDLAEDAKAAVAATEGALKAQLAV
ncbi:hypothetical protein PIB30_055108 [Stylosanthes scabra]|uniref:Uncharacterized protein n=1 Tax=Stylosanthes scabra TaxID=79078 RepID=A0ABU6UM00_9FABA|nr:hypothetical protein [Stylosanthes scabra]